MWSMQALYSYLTIEQKGADFQEFRTLIEAVYGLMIASYICPGIVTPNITAERSSRKKP